MTVTELAQRVAAEQGLHNIQARKLIDAVVRTVVEAAKDGADVTLPGFGTFKIQDRPERQGRNPATGAAITIAAARKLSFVPAKALKDALNG